MDRVAGIEWNHIPYNSGNEASVAVAGGQGGPSFRVATKAYTPGGTSNVKEPSDIVVAERV